MKHKTLPTIPNPIPKPTQTKKMTRFNSTPIPICFRPSSTAPTLEYPNAPPSTTASTATTSTPNLTTCLYQTHLGIFSLTWSRSLMSRSFHLHLHQPPPSLSTTQPPPLSLSSPSFHLTLKPFLFWTKHGLKKLPPPSPTSSSPLYLFWDLSSAKFGPGPEPISGFYIALVFEGELVLLVGDLEKEALSKTKLKKTPNNEKKLQSLVIRREHVFGNRFYTTRTDFGGKSRVILIELNTSSEEDPRLVIRFDSKRVLQVKHLKWKFRGSERIEVDGYPIQLSWDVYNWLFEDEDCGTHDDGLYALFTFRFEQQHQGHNSNKNQVLMLKECFEAVDENEREMSFNGGSGSDGNNGAKKGVFWSQDSCGLNYERKKMKKKLLVKTRSSSSSSISSASSGSSSVLEWESVEENELKGPTGFSLLVYAWKS